MHRDPGLGFSMVKFWDRITRLAGGLRRSVRFITTPNHVLFVLWTNGDDTQHIRFIMRRRATTI